MSVSERAYWTQQMEAAYGYMQRLLEYPLQECGQQLASLADKARQSDVKMAFAPGRKLDMFDRVFHVRESLIEPLLRAAEALAGRGYVLRVEDAYRSPKTQMCGARSQYVIQSVLERVRWELDGRTPTGELVMRRLAVWTATTLKFANHTSGSAVDVTVLDSDGRPADLGGTYPQLSHMTPMASPFISADARRNRRIMCDLLAEEGFAAYPYEFWHFSCGDADSEMLTGEGRAGRFGPVHWRQATGAVAAAEDLLKPLVTIDDILPYLADPPAENSRRE